MIKKTVTIACWVFVCLMVGVIGAYSTAGSIKIWYAELSRPSFAPPNWTFGVVWPILYVMMGVSAFLVWNRGIDHKHVRIALSVFVLQLVLNGLWTPIFFGLHLIGWALAEIVLLWFAVAATIILFWRASRTAALLLVPYILWVSFAIALNAGFWILNR